MRNFHSIPVPHVPHFPVRSALVWARDSLNVHGIEIAVRFAILFGVLILLGFWAVVAR
jgi:hypothetical protein